MKKTKSGESIVTPRISPSDALRFLEDMRLLTTEIDRPRVSISLRVPANLLNALKTKAKSEGKKYQSMMLEILRKSLRESL